MVSLTAVFPCKSRQFKKLSSNDRIKAMVFYMAPETPENFISSARPFPDFTYDAVIQKFRLHFFPVSQKIRRSLQFRNKTQSIRVLFSVVQ